MKKTLASLSFVIVVLCAVALILSGFSARAQNATSLAQIMSNDPVPATTTLVDTNIKRQGVYATVSMVVVYRQTFSDQTNIVARDPHDYNTFRMVVDCESSTTQMQNLRLHRMDGSEAVPMLLTPVDGVDRAGALYRAACRRDFDSFHNAVTYGSTEEAAKAARERMLNLAAA